MSAGPAPIPANLKQAVITKLTNSQQLIAGESFVLDATKFSAIQNAIISNDKINEVELTKYEEIAKAPFGVATGNQGQVVAGSEGRPISVPFPTDITNQSSYIAEFILKKRAAIVYMCMLYIKKIKESEQAKLKETKQLKSVLAALSSLKTNMISIKEKDKNLQKVSIQTIQVVNDPVSDNMVTNINNILNEVTAMIEAKNASGRTKDDLLKEIIPFIATSATVDTASLPK